MEGEGTAETAQVVIKGSAHLHVWAWALVRNCGVWSSDHDRRGWMGIRSSQPSTRGGLQRVVLKGLFEIATCTSSPS
ncbi:hypothetical protein PR002_g15997 [Phytophthora rubi]|uniref:Uncharacterized protein n=1 Tax=Phytophthora rubi TaxID=129364 RepID=A0A6A3KX89_9STRA|nr:hypothetical protein PR002_g15997 [Phytophthora rubi]